MANRRREPVTYRPFRTEPVLADGLLAVARPGGEVQARIADALFGAADQIGAARQAEKLREAEGADQDVLANAPGGGVDTAPATGEPGAWRDAIASIESAGSGNYAAIGPRHPKLGRAMGRYQVMEANIGPWSKRHLGRAVSVDEFMRDPKLQDAIFDAEFGSYVSRFGSPEAAAQAWFAGPGGVGKTGRKDSLGTSVGVYGDKFRAAMGRLGPGTPEMAGNAPAARPSWRPRAGRGAADRAYNERGIRVYQQLLETRMVASVDALEQKHKGDPDGLAAALEENRQRMLRADVFPEVQAAFEVGYGNLAQRAVFRVREEKTKADQAATNGKFREDINRLETDATRRIAGFAGDSADLAETIGTDLALIDRQFQIGVDNGSITAEQAAEGKARAKGALVSGYYMQQASRTDAAGVEAMRAEMTADFADGGVPGLDGTSFAQLDADLQRLEKQKRSEAENTTQAFRVRGDQMVARIGAGFEVDQAAMSQMMLDAGRTPEGKAALEETLAKISDARAVRDMNLQEASAWLGKLRGSIGEAPTDAQLRRLASAELQLEGKRKAIQADQLAYAESRKIVPETPRLTDAESADDMAAIVQTRLLTAPKAAAELGVSPRYLKAGEAKAIGDLIRKDPANGAAVAGAIVSGAGDRAAAVLAEFGDDAPIVTESGAILALGGSAAAAEDVIRGYGRGGDGKVLKGMKPALQKTSFRAVTGDALAMAPRDAGRIERAAASIARFRISQDGLDPESDEAQAVHARAVQEAAGAVFDRGQQFGGFVEYGAWAGTSTVLVPNEIRADLFEDVIGSITDDDLAGLTQKPMPGVATFWSGKDRLAPALTIKRARPVAVAGGFAFAMGDPASDDPQFVQGDDGEVFVLDLMGLRQQLAPRVAGAFR